MAAIPSTVRVIAGESGKLWPGTRRGGVRAGVRRRPDLVPLLLGGREVKNESECEWPFMPFSLDGG